jgi:hypothetical protein
MNPIDAYQMFTAVKLHFTSDGYDYFRYHGKVRVDADKFETRRDKYHYYKLTKAEELGVAILSEAELEQLLTI